MTDEDFRKYGYLRRERRVENVRFDLGNKNQFPGLDEAQNQKGK